jgi:hypothetical protein
MYAFYHSVKNEREKKTSMKQTLIAMSQHHHSARGDETSTTKNARSLGEKVDWRWQPNLVDRLEPSGTIAVLQEMFDTLRDTRSLLS